MPCGGIYSNHPYLGGMSSNAVCFQCAEEAGYREMLFVEEWDTSIHRSCLSAFLSTDEGKIIMCHGHEIYIEEFK